MNEVRRHNASARLRLAAAAPKRGRPTAEEAGDRAERLLDLATTMFLDRGYAGTSINALAAAAGVTKRTIYARFADKAELFAAVIRRMMKPELTDQLAADEGLPFADALLRHSRAILQATVAPQSLAFASLVQREGHRFPELRRLQHDTLIAPLRRDLKGLLARYQARGAVAPGDPGAMAGALMTTLLGDLALRLLRHDTIPDDYVDAYLPSAIELFLHGVAVRPRC